MQQINYNSRYEKNIYRMFASTISLYILMLGVSVAGIQLYLFPYVGMCIITFIYCGTKYRVNNYGQIILFGMFLHTNLVNLLNGTFELDYMVKMLILCLTPTMLCKAIRREKLYYNLFIIMAVCVAISSSVAICQGLKLDWAYDIWINRFYNDSLRGAQLLQSLQGGRSAGLASYSLNLGFQIVQILLIVFAMLLTNDAKRKVRGGHASIA